MAAIKQQVGGDQTAGGGQSNSRWRQSNSRWRQSNSRWRHQCHGGGGGPTINILEGAPVQGSPDFDPEDLTAKKGDEVTVVNHDTVPHTVTSGTGSSDPNSAKSFDTSIINGGK